MIDPERIKQRAYFIYRRRQAKGKQGDPFSDYMEAQRELKADEELKENWNRGEAGC